MQIALNYTKHEFALFVSEEDLDLICKAVNYYSKKESVSFQKLVEVNNLSTTDLYHFGWNIWNHFGGSKHQYQKEIADLLKSLFKVLNPLTVKTIKSHLTDSDTKNTIIKLQESLTVYK